MSKPDSFIATSDFPTLKQSGSASADVTIPASISVAGNSEVNYQTDITLGSAGAIVRTRFASSYDGGAWYAGQACSFDRVGKNSGIDAVYTIYAFTWRPSPGIIRCQIHINNPYSTTLTGITSDDTISFYVMAFVPPFA